MKGLKSRNLFKLAIAPLLILCFNAVAIAGISPPVNSFARPIQPNQRITRSQLNRLIHLATPQSYQAMRDFLGNPAYAYANVEYYPLMGDESVWIGLIWHTESNRYTGFIISIENW